MTNIRYISGISRDGCQNVPVEDQKINKRQISSDINPAIRSKWIVVTSIQSPTNDIKNLASQPGWQLLVVADTKTPTNWSYPNVEFLSVVKQEALFGRFKVPYKSYTRKNLGYLYAIMNGAEWIYDTDDDNKPYGLGLDQFDYSPTVSGLIYSPAVSANISQKLFNPYQFFGFKNMWPRGFPLEYLKNHKNSREQMISCRKMKTPAVQQGLVKKDPDVDAVYRLLHADQENGLDVEFNSLAPPIVLNSESFAPWNSQNTLLHYNAFFLLYLPTTVAFRVTDIWRSYFAQKLLVLIGENIAFYPTNAVQIRNAHNYLSDFHQEIDVYEKTGKMISVLDQWKCSQKTIQACTLELADIFVEHKFFGKEDRNLLGRWIEELTHVGYRFPRISSPVASFSDEIGSNNCRSAHLDLETEIYNSENVLVLINNFPWMPVKSSGFLQHIFNLFKLNHPATSITIGLLQRLYSPFFKSVVFCGTWNNNYQKTGQLDPLEPINFVNISPEEMRGGKGYGYCVSKIRDLRLQNVSGYYFLADDAIFNFWHKLPLDEIVNPVGISNDSINWESETMATVLKLIEVKYKNDKIVQQTWEEYKQGITKNYGKIDVRNHFIRENIAILSDFLYLPADRMDYVANLMELFVEAEVFVETAFGKIMNAVAYSRGGNFAYLWKEQREQVYDFYEKDLLGIHPTKLSAVHNNKSTKERFCSTVVKTFVKEIFKGR